MLTRIEAAQFITMPWRNGRGVTTEIARSPAAGEFEWRISMAPIEEDGAFSRFPGCERLIVPIRGAGMSLRHGQSSKVTVSPLTVYRFSGDDETSCSLIDGPIIDLNLMVRRGAFTGAIEVVKSVINPEPASGAVTVAYALHGEVEIRAGADSIFAAEGSAIRIEAAGSAVITPRGTAIVISAWPV